MDCLPGACPAPSNRTAGLTRPPAAIGAASASVPPKREGRGCWIRILFLFSLQAWLPAATVPAARTPRHVVGLLLRAVAPDSRFPSTDKQPLRRLDAACMATAHSVARTHDGQDPGRAGGEYRPETWNAAAPAASAGGIYHRCFGRAVLLRAIRSCGAGAVQGRRRSPGRPGCATFSRGRPCIPPFRPMRAYALDISSTAAWPSAVRPKLREALGARGPPLGPIANRYLGTQCGGEWPPLPAGYRLTSHACAAAATGWVQTHVPCMRCRRCHQPRETALVILARCPSDHLPSRRLLVPACESGRGGGGAVWVAVVLSAQPPGPPRIAPSTLDSGTREGDGARLWCLLGTAAPTAGRRPRRAPSEHRLLYRDPGLPRASCTRPTASLALGRALGWSDGRHGGMATPTSREGQGPHRERLVEKGWRMPAVPRRMSRAS